MAGVHRLHHVERLGAPDLADDNAVGSHAEGVADQLADADATDPLRLAEKVRKALDGNGADVTVVCVDVPGCEHGAVLATADGGTVVFFSMATSFTAAALGAEGLAADVEMLIGNGYVPGHAEYALELLRANPHLKDLYIGRFGKEAEEG